MRTLDDTTPWANVRLELRFTRATLKASKTHASELKELQKLLDRWSTLDQELTDAEDGVVDANALVAFCDGVLDRALEGFVRDLDHAVKGDRSDPRFTAFFTEAPNAVIRLALESELERTAHFDDAAKDAKLPKYVAESLQTVLAARAEGREAVKAREGDEKTEASAWLKVRRLKEDANAVRRSVYNTLERYAIDHDLGDDYPDRFFQSPTKARKKPTPKSDGGKPAEEKKGEPTR